MTLIDRYIARHVLGGFLLVLLVVAGLDMMFALVEELSDVGARKSYEFFDAVWYVLLTGPRRLYEFIPLSSLIGCLLGLGVLASSSELVVMRAAGVSTLRIIHSVMKPVFVIIVAALALGEFVMPITEQQAQSYRQLRITGEGAIHEASRVWHRDEMTFLHINAVVPDGSVRGVTRYDFNEDLTLARSSFARMGVYEEGQWRLYDIKESRFPPITADSSLPRGSIKTGILDEEVWVSGLTPDLLQAVMVKPENLSIAGLLSYSDYLNEQGLASAQYRVALWSKLFLPLSVLALVLVAVSFIFGPLRSVTVGQRLITGIIIGLAFKLTQDIVGPFSAVFGFWPMLAVLIPILICAAFGLWLLRKAG